MGTRMEHILAFKIDFGSTDVLRERFREIETRRTTGVIAQHVGEILLKARITAGLRVGLGEIQQRSHQSLWDIHSAKLSEATMRIGNRESRVGGRNKARGRHRNTHIKREANPRASDKGKS